jgi:hypothetical protein
LSTGRRRKDFLEKFGGPIEDLSEDISNHSESNFRNRDLGEMRDRRLEKSSEFASLDKNLKEFYSRNSRMIQ